MNEKETTSQWSGVVWHDPGQWPRYKALQIDLASHNFPTPTVLAFLRPRGTKLFELSIREIETVYCSDRDLQVKFRWSGLAVN